MLRRIGRGLDSLIDHYVAAAVVLALFILSLVGVGDVAAVSLLGLLLCVVGLGQAQPARADLWILVPLLIYDLACMASALRTYGNIVDGYGALHGIFPLLCLLSACVEGEGRRLLKGGCLLWAGTAAAVGIGQFAFQAVVQGRVGRMSGVLGNPNAMGIFLVMGWALSTGWDQSEEEGGTAKLSFLGPLFLMAAAMTLSMGSFLAMAAGIGALVWERKRTAPWRETFRYACRLLAKASLGVGTGLLIYLAGARTGAPWSCLPLLLYGGAVIASWRTFGRFLEAKPRMAALIAGMGALVALTAVAARPSSIATFTERLEMMGSGLSYLTAEPLFGVGPFQWRLLDLNDGGKYFNTWHIHNVPIHIGVEMGWIGMATIVLAGLRALTRRQEPAERAMTAAFLFHNMIDTSFFYLGITALALTAAGGPREEGRGLGSRGTKLLFALLAALFAYSLYHTIALG